MITALELVLPVFAIIAIGYASRRTGFLAEGFWPPAEKLTYYILLPALIIQSLATRHLDVGVLGPVAITGFCTIIGMSLVLHMMRPVLGIPGPAFASVHQASIRLNGLLAIGVLLSLFGDRVVPIVGILIAIWIPTSNTLSVFAYVRHRPGGRISPGRIALEVARNPAVSSVAIGIVLNLVGAGRLIAQVPFFEILGRAALPVGLLTVGAALNPASVRADALRVGTACVFKLLLMPVVAIGLARAIGLDPLAMAAMVAFAAMPTSPGGYVLASQLGGDARLMASIITAQHAVALVTMTLFAAYAVGGLM